MTFQHFWWNSIETDGMERKLSIHPYLSDVEAYEAAQVLKG
jgi:hypothetical protein